MTSRRAARRLAGLAGLVLALAAGGTAALSADKDQPIDLEADAADIDEAKGVSVYTGNVIATQGSMRLESDRLTVHHPSGKAQRIEADGRPARFQQLPDGQTVPVRARADHLEYQMTSEELVMTGGAELIQGRDTFKSDRIVYDRVKSVVKGGAAAKGSERVRITVDPKSPQQGAASAAAPAPKTLPAAPKPAGPAAKPAAPPAAKGTRQPAAKAAPSPAR
jgi:lipopolysaccharide export system protein LptA